MADIEHLLFQSFLAIIFLAGLVQPLSAAGVSSVAPHTNHLIFVAPKGNATAEPDIADKRYWGTVKHLLLPSDTAAAQYLCLPACNPEYSVSINVKPQKKEASQYHAILMLASANLYKSIKDSQANPSVSRYDTSLDPATGKAVIAAWRVMLNRTAADKNSGRWISLDSDMIFFSYRSIGKVLWGRLPTGSGPDPLALLSVGDNIAELCGAKKESSSNESKRLNRRIRESCLVILKNVH